MARSRKNLISVALIATLCMTFLLTSCKSETLESYASESEGIMATIEEASGEEGVDVSIDGNTLVYAFKYDLELDEDAKERIKEQLQKNTEQYESVFGSLAATLEEKTEIEGIKIKLRYLDASDKAIYEGEFTSK